MVLAEGWIALIEQFNLVQPMKAKLSDISFLKAVSDDPVWGAGEKFDGYREVLYLGSGRNEMLSSLGNSHIDKVPQFKVVVPGLAGTVLDCEGMAPTRMLEDNASCFKAYPENAIVWQEHYGRAYLVAFDILRYRGLDITGNQFGSRRVVMEYVLMQLHSLGIPIMAERLVFRGKLDYYTSIVARSQSEGHEGVILKRMDAPYEPGRRSPNWLKVKREEEVIAIITGFTPGFGKFEGMIGSVVFKGDGVEGAASGMDDAERLYMTEHPECYVGKKALFVGQAKTRHGALRHPRYKGLVD